MSAKSSRRRRWEVKSKESFESSLAMAPERDSPDKQNIQPGKNNQRKTSAPAELLTENKNASEADYDTSEDILSAKLSAILDDVNKPVYSSDYESGKDICFTPDQKESKNPFDEEDGQKTDTEDSRPTAPPLSPDEKTKKKVSKSKKEREKKVSYNNSDQSAVTSQLKHLKEDVVKGDRNDPNNNNDAAVLALPGLLIGQANAEHIRTLYCEKMNGFVIASDKNLHSQENEKLKINQNIDNRASHAVFTQTGFRSFSVFCQGLLAGICLAHCLLIFLLDTNPVRTAELYSPWLAHVFYFIILFLINICFVAACDRCDIRGNGVFFGHGIRIPWTPALYVSALVLTFVTVRTEDVLTHRELMETKMPSEIASLVQWWQWMCVARTAVIILAWGAIVPDPHTDLFNVQLSSID